MQPRRYDYSDLISWLLALLPYIYAKCKILYILSCNSTTLGARYYNSYFTDKETGAQGAQILLKENIIWQELESDSRF